MGMGMGMPGMGMGMGMPGMGMGMGMPGCMFARSGCVQCAVKVSRGHVPVSLVTFCRFQWI